MVAEWQCTSGAGIVIQDVMAGVHAAELVSVLLAVDADVMNSCRP
jgi:hypothetical protein